MGLLERSPTDNSPFRPNEYHVDRTPSPGASINHSQTLDGRITRTNSSSTDSSRERRRHRSNPNRLQNRQNSAPQQVPTARSRPSTLTRIRQGEDSRSAARLAALAHSQSQNAEDDEVDARLSTIAVEHNIPGRGENALDNEDPASLSNRNQPATSRNFAPARRYYEHAQRGQRGHYFAVTEADLGQTSGGQPGSQSGSRSGSPGGNSRWRVSSPDTEQAILQELRNQENPENRFSLNANAPAESSSRIPRMVISSADGLGDRRRSPSHDNDNNNPDGNVEENWTDLMETIPAVDANQPSVGSSFASDSASSILSRSRTRTSTTNTPLTDSRAGSLDGGPVLQSGIPYYCPEDAGTHARQVPATLAPRHRQSRRMISRLQQGFFDWWTRFVQEERAMMGFDDDEADVFMEARELALDMLVNGEEDDDEVDRQAGMLVQAEADTAEAMATGTATEAAAAVLTESAAVASVATRAARLTIQRARARAQAQAPAGAGLRPVIQPPSLSQRERRAMESEMISRARRLLEARQNAMAAQQAIRWHPAGGEDAEEDVPASEQHDDDEDDDDEDNDNEEAEAGNVREPIDELLDLINNGVEVPTEMWTAFGITPHLGVRAAILGHTRAGGNHQLRPEGEF